MHFVSPATDREHREQVVPAVQGMIEPILPAIQRMPTRVRLRQRWQEGEDQCDEPPDISLHNC